METTIRATPPAVGGVAGTRTPSAQRPGQPDAQSRPGRIEQASASGRSPAPLKRGISGYGTSTQDDVARAQQALDYLDRVSSQLEMLKGQLAAKLSGARGDEQQLEARVRQLAASLAERRKSGGVDARLNFNGKPATQRFRIRGLDIATLQAQGEQSLAFSIGGAGGPQLSAKLEPGMTRKEIAQRLDRTLAPLKVHAELDEQGQLVFSTDETTYAAVKDSIAVSGRGRVQTEALSPEPDPQQWDTGEADALRQSLREVVQALARVRRSQESARAALDQATARAAQAGAAADAAEAAKMADDFISTAASPNYESLLAITSALVGVSRERVLALLGQH
ncbi:hypothetical protein [Massilia horti]|uniref:Flagellin n=1 Tax=Massilia horti TaxID=2562153 RepID=A0A4Y9STD0_9BURK|nr:hypothetical protein [Massilia horti]TFW29708.1 hypothetical protein E4O92_18255 [Massilia horti]